jgi:hypothetical protein
MTDETTPTPAAAPTPAPTVVVVAPVAVTKPWYAQISNYAGAFVGIVGNALPYITPDFLTSIGVSATAAHTISSIVAVILVAYKEKAKPVEQTK